MSIYENIKKRRLELKMSQGDLARALGYADHSAIAHIERGRIDLPQSKVVAIAKALQTTPGELMGDVVSPQVKALVLKLVRLSDAQLAAVEVVVDQLLKGGVS